MTLLDLPVIDCHTHIGQLPGALGDAYTAEDLNYIMAHEGVRFMLVSSASTNAISQTYGTDEALAMVQRYPNLGGMLWINPRDPAWKIDVERAAQHGFYGIKLHPVLDHYAVEPKGLDEIFAVAQVHHWPILTHADSDGSPMSAGRYEPLLKAYPDVPLILAHLRLEGIPLARRYDNAYLDITYVDPLMVEVGVAAVGPDKILFGSDAAEGFEVGHAPGRVRPRRCYADLLAGIRARGISDAALEKICYQNAKALFRIPL